MAQQTPEGNPRLNIHDSAEANLDARGTSRNLHPRIVLSRHRIVPGLLANLPIMEG